VGAGLSKPPLKKFLDFKKQPGNQFGLLKSFGRSETIAGDCNISQ